MRIFRTEKEAFAVAGDTVAEMAKAGKPNCGFRVLRCNDGFKVLMVPERGDGDPFYLDIGREVDWTLL